MSSLRRIFDKGLLNIASKTQQRFMQAASTHTGARTSSRGGHVEVFTSRFMDMHAKYQAARYKVHRPGCSCSIMKRIRKKLAEAPWSVVGLDSVETKSMEANDTAITGETDLSSGLDGLVVLSHNQPVDAIYLCLDTGDESILQNAVRAELKLKEELFPSTTARTELPKLKFKVSCAQCMLAYEPNGFVCVSSPSLQTVETARDLARKGAEQKEKNGFALHSDHARDVCAIPRRALWALAVAKTRGQTAVATLAVLDQMRRQGVSLEDDDNRKADDKLPSSRSIKMGHHLVSLLHITQREKNADSAFWLVMVESITSSECTIDLPGGKRHLGESCFESAIRETAEETSLQIDQAWVVGEPRNSKHHDSDLFFMLQPPAHLLMKEVESNPFWSATTIDDSPSHARE